MSWKKHLSMLLALVMCLSLLPSVAWASEEMREEPVEELLDETEEIVGEVLDLDGSISDESEDNLTWAVADGVLTVSGEGDMLAIPELVPDEPIYKIVIEEGVTSIQDYAFSNVLGNTWYEDSMSVVLPSSVKSIGYSAFYKVGGSIGVPANYPHYTRWSFTHDVFYAGTEEQWKEILVGDQNSYLNGACMHYSCIDHTLKKVEAQAATATTLGWKEHFRCSSCGKLFLDSTGGKELLPEDAYVLPKGVTAMDRGECGDRTGWLLGDNGTIYIVGEGALEGRPGYADAKKLVIAEGVTRIGKYVFNVGNWSVTTIVLPASVTEIDDAAFTTNRYAAKPHRANYPYYSRESFQRDVFYLGTETDWNKIQIGADNDYLIDSCIHFGVPAHALEKIGATAPTEIEFGNIEHYECGICGKLYADVSGETELLPADVVIPMQKMIIMETGVCGDTAGWILTGEGELYVVGKGAMEDRPSPLDDVVKEVHIGSGITRLGSLVFDCETRPMDTIHIPESVIAIDEKAFFSNTRSSIHDGKATYVSYLADVYYTGSEAAWTAVIISEGNEPLTQANIHYGSETALESYPGDVNHDGVVDRKDRIYLARYLAGWDGYELIGDAYAAADVNHDGTVDRKDRIYLARHLAGWEGYTL